DREAGVRVGVVGPVRGAAAAAAGCFGLVARAREVHARAATATAPGGLVRVVAAAIDGEARAADGQDVRRDGRPDRGGAAVAAGGDEGDAGVAGRRGEVVLVAH